MRDGSATRGGEEPGGGGALGARSGRGAVSGAQRARLLEAVAEVALERGLRGASTTRVAQRAGVSRSTLTEQFGSVDGCFLALLDWMLERVTALLAEAFEREPSWSEGVLAGLEALLPFMDEEQVRARACLLEGTTAPAAALRARVRELGRLGELVDGRARSELSLERQPPESMYEATIGSVLGLLRRRLLSGEAPPFATLLGPLAEVVVAPYLGPSAAGEAARAGRERSRALLEEHSARLASTGVEAPSLLRHANAHRLRECMRYLAEHPGASNRAIGAGIGVSHPGQVSALLARLREAGLLEGRAGRAGRPNAWRLSPYGAQVVPVLRRW